MTDEWPSNITHTYELGSQRGPAFDDELRSFDDVINAFIKSGWRIINSYVEGKGTDSSREECVCLMGWAHEGAPKYPAGYGKS